MSLRLVYFNQHVRLYPLKATSEVVEETLYEQ